METRRIIRDGRGSVIGWELDSGGIPATHKTVFDAEAFKLLLTDDEFDAMRESSSNLVVKAYHRLVNRNGEVNTESNVFARVMAAAISAGDITEERAAVLGLGVPV